MLMYMMLRCTLTLSHLGEYLDGYLELGANLKVSRKSGRLLLGVLADEGSHLESLATV